MAAGRGGEGSHEGLSRMNRGRFAVALVTSPVFVHADLGEFADRVCAPGWLDGADAGLISVVSRSRS